MSNQFELLQEWLHAVRATKVEENAPVIDAEEFKLWIMNLWFPCWQDVLTYLVRNRLEAKVFQWGIDQGIWNHEFISLPGATTPLEELLAPKS